MLSLILVILSSEPRFKVIVSLLLFSHLDFTSRGLRQKKYSVP